MFQMVVGEDVQAKGARRAQAAAFAAAVIRADRWDFRSFGIASANQLLHDDLLQLTRPPYDRAS
jgi:LDH2 family malate/lactate/ureidoglycolate dehydrogenase